jgi:hypothetical protein
VISIHEIVYTDYKIIFKRIQIGGAKPLKVMYRFKVILLRANVPEILEVISGGTLKGFRDMIGSRFTIKEANIMTYNFKNEDIVSLSSL